ncbi:SDR family NAD(P)-dependent oxidoreductase [Sphingobium subterraneum]|uniref:NAD(P)-dependent dehydrogenase (Short-subunit alcohol dehydrogenase family) n=1 Tax=Sphingobium subterraneum TaxID=627688 RepID=A0A841J314_9SPHN|nr:SDR family NAD(P)-dependent oxidoreductase [Sphingobium subterraneum]MBB6125353.1 NAD(P)-dependent dehydrogenase (short-subunit alcohol dehydrogenase family) [Sphingobium subterraneum]
MEKELRLDGQVALVTGSGRGLGRAHALLLAARGAAVVVNDPGGSLEGDGEDRMPADGVVEDITSAGGQAVANFDSVASEAGASAMVAAAIDHFGRIDIVVNNAGNFLPRRSFTESSSESFAKIWAVHTMGSINVIRAAWPHMVGQGYGRIVNTASHTGLLGSRGSLEYSVAKAAILGLTKTLALEAAELGIAVNAIAPGALTRPVNQMEEVAQLVPPGAFEPDLVSPTVLWLCHPECGVNGEVLGVMSGTTTRIKIAETQGYWSSTPTPEAIRDHFTHIMAEETLAGSGLTFGQEAETRGMELMMHYISHA